MTYHLWRNSLLVFLTIYLTVDLYAQDKPTFSFGKGIEVVAPDSAASMKFNFNLQNRIDVKTLSTDDWGVDEFSVRIKRFRLKFTGFLIDPRLSYQVQLALAPRNISGPLAEQAPQTMYQAIIYYQFDKRLKIGFGQIELPGNRQRMNSSTSMQMVDRSLANSTYALDLDFGLHGEYKLNPEGRQPLVLHGAITSGEGQNWVAVTDGSLSYTGRLDWYPLGSFISNGAYKESDLEWHTEPRLMAGISYNYNENAMRTGGQRGNLLYEQRDISTLFSDIIFKYQGWALQGAYMVRNSDVPITYDSDGTGIRYIHNGEGWNFQFGKYFKSKWEVVGQFTNVLPAQEIENVAAQRRDWTVGLNRYLKGRAIKIQADFTLFQSRTPGNDFTDQLGATIQAQVGI